MNTPSEEQLKLNYTIGSLCWILGTIALVLDGGPPSWMPEGYGFIIGTGFFLMGLQSIRLDFGPLHWGCLFRFLLLLAVVVVAIYLIN